MNLIARTSLLLILLGCSTLAAAQTAQTSSTATSTSLGSTLADRVPVLRSTQAATDAMMAQLWGLSAEEMARASTLLKGPRAAFSVANLSPIEALGIHARTPAERAKYAEMFARAHMLDVERVVAWNKAFNAAWARMPSQPVIAFDALEHPEMDPFLASAARVPQSAITAAPSKRRPK